MLEQQRLGPLVHARRAGLPQAAAQQRRQAGRIDDERRRRQQQPLERLSGGVQQQAERQHRLAFPAQGRSGETCAFAREAPGPVAVSRQALDQQIGRASIQYLHRQAHARHRPVSHAQLRLAVQRPAQPLQRRRGIGRGVQAHADNGIFRPLGMTAPGAGLQGGQRESFERFARGRLHSGLQVF